MTRAKAREARDASARVIALVEWNTSGHHRSYLRLYSKALLELGVRLLVLSPESAELGRWWAGEGAVPEEARARGVCRELPRRTFSVKKWRWRHVGRRFFHARALRRALSAGEEALGANVEAVFFACIYEWEARWVTFLVRSFGLPWGGLYLQAATYRGVADLRGRVTEGAISRLWREGELRGLLTLDEEMVERIAADAEAPVVAAPDLTEASLPAVDVWRGQVCRFRRGRPLIGVFGHLVPSKGLVTLAKMGRLPRAGGWAFLVVGEVDWGRFSNGDRVLIEALLADAARVFRVEGRVADEVSYNELVSCCDVLWAAYDEFPHSSNTLGKAAAFGLPVVVTEGQLMARRVARYRLGECARSRDADSASEAIERIIGRGGRGAWEEAVLPDREGYLAAHGEEALRRALAVWLTGRC
jgi:glycosyltransferase involved in cell wall biosynthesis